MNRVTKAQKEKVAQFCGVTGAPPAVALACLSRANWAVGPAVDTYYSSGAAPAAARVNMKAVGALFERYAEKGGEVMLADGILSLLGDLGVDPEDPVTLVLSWHMRAASMGEFSRAEWERGMRELGVDSLEGLRASLPTMRAELESEAAFALIYAYAYGFSCDKGQKCVQQDAACAMWGILLPPERWELTPDWCDFLARRHNRAISRDTWIQLLEFIRSVEPDFSNYDDAGSWPYLLDEFVEEQRAKLADRA